MTPEERIQAGGVTLVFDAANVSTATLFRLAKAALSSGVEVRCVVPATAHLEKLFDTRQKKGAEYRAAIVRAALEDAGVEVLSLDAGQAELAAERLYGWFPDNESWQQAKRARIGKIGNVGAAPATIDWVTAAMCPNEAIVITDDRGQEFRGCERMGSEELRVALTGLAGAKRN